MPPPAQRQSDPYAEFEAPADDPYAEFDASVPEPPRSASYVAPTALTSSEQASNGDWVETAQAAPDAVGGVGTGTNVGSDTVPEHYRPTGRRELVLPEVDISVDPRGRRPDVVREHGQATEIVEIGKDPEYAAQRRRNMVATIERERAQREAAQRPPDIPATPLDLPRVLERVLSNGDFDLGNVGGRDLNLTPRHVQHTARLMGEANADPAREMDAGDVLNSLFPVVGTDEPIVGEDARDVAGMHGLANRMNMGMGDEIEDAAYGEGEGDEYQARQQLSREQAPETYAMGELAGTLPLALIPGNQATAFGRIGTTAGVGFGTGALRGAGEYGGEDLEGRALAGLAGGVLEGGTSAALGGLGEGASAGLNRLGQWGNRMREPAARLRLSAGGIRDATARGRIDNPTRAAEVMRETGISRGLQSTRSSGERAAEVRRAANAEIDRLVQEADDAAEAARNSATYRDLPGASRPARPLGERQEIHAADIPIPGTVQRDRLIGELQRLRNSIGGQGPGASARARIDDLIENYNSAHPDGNIPLDDIMEDWRAFGDPRNFAEGARWNPLASSGADLRRLFRNAMEDAMESASGPGARQTLAQSLERVHVGRTAQEGAERIAERAGGNRLLSPTDYLAGGMSGVGAGMMSGSPITGLATTAAIAGGNRLLRTYEYALGASTLEGLSSVLRRMGPRGAQWSRTLDAARSRGQTALAATHYALMRQDPEYRQAVEAAQNEEQE